MKESEMRKKKRIAEREKKKVNNEKLLTYYVALNTADKKMPSILFAGFSGVIILSYRIGLLLLLTHF